MRRHKVQENFFIDQTSYDTFNNLTQSRIRIYSTSSDVGTDTNVIATYQMDATYDSDGNMSDYKFVKQ